MRLRSQISLLAAILLATPVTTFAQKGRGGEDPEHLEVHRSLSAIEAEMRALIDQNEAALEASIANAEELRKAKRELIKSDRKDEQKNVTQVHQLEHEASVRALAIELNRTRIQRLQLEMDNLNQYDTHLIEEQDDRGRPGFRKPVRAPQIQSITVLKEERSSPTRVTGIGFGIYTTRLYEVVFSDGTRQRVESKDFTPTQRR